LSRRLVVALVHYPIVDAQKNVVTTAITNLDIHDISRSARTYGCTDYFLIHPIEAQQELLGRILGHWREGSSGRRIPARKEALSLARGVRSLADMFDALGGRDAVEVWVTSASPLLRAMTFPEAKARLDGEGKPVVIVFGTGWGLAPSVIENADAALVPIRGEGSTFNHLSVRAACAITLDRLRGAQ
jgi:hypothetical protein